METLLQKYALIEANLLNILEEKDQLRREILKFLLIKKLEKVESEYGSFTVARKKLWQYSPAIEKKEESLKIAKVREQDKGLAKVLVSNYLLYRLPKEN